MDFAISLISRLYNWLWGDLFALPLPGGDSVGISLLVLLLIPTGVYFTIRTRFLPIRLFPEMLRVTAEKRTGGQVGAISGVQALIVSTATRVGMGNLIGVVAAISAGGAGAESPAAIRFWQCCSPSPASSAGAASVKLSAIPSPPPFKMPSRSRLCTPP